MKSLILLFTVITTIQTHAGLFDNGEKERRIQAEQQLQHERQTNDSLRIVIIILGVGAIGLFVIGTAIGSQIRHHGKQQ